jgi:translation initiation factor 4A
MLGRIDFRRMGTPQGLVLSPSRELAQQTYDVVTSIGEYLAGGATFCQLLVGGTRVVDDIRRLQGGATTVAVGCPGRVADLLRRGAMRADGLRVVVLDEADEMLSQGFAEQVYGIFRFLPKDVQVALFSATLPPDVLALASRFMREPTRILVAAETLTLKGIKQFYVAVADEAEKMVVLTDLYESVSVAQSVVFCGHRRKVDYVADEMNRGGHTVSRMHSELQRGDREKVMAAFRGGSSRVLVTTDLVGRGIDVQHVNVVINYDMPSSAESYLHRIGRSGRYGRRGIAISFVTERDVAALQAIEAHFRTTVAELPSDFARYLSEDDDHS